MADLTSAVAESRRAGLTAIRNHLADALERVDPHQAAPLAKQLAEVMRELEMLGESKGSTVDVLAARRAARREAGA